MSDLIKPGKSSGVCCYFITGTGRCGTMLAAKLLSLGSNTFCEHERSIAYAKMKPAYLMGSMDSLYEEIDTVIEPLVASHNREGRSYGEISGLMYLTFEELYARYGRRARFVLLTRHPQEFVRSALARGFFDADHPHALEHLRARPDTEIGRRWESTNPFEKCLWYWNLVNGIVHRFFCTLPDGLWKVQPIEGLDVAASRRLYTFLQVEGFDEQAVRELLAIRINSTPGIGDERHVNPWSRPMTVGDYASWDRAQREAYETWIVPVIDLFYPTIC